MMTSPNAPSAETDRFYRRLSKLVVQRHPEARLDIFQGFYSLVAAFEATMAFLSRRLSRYGLSAASFNVLMLLAHDDPQGCPMHRLGRLLLVTRANITGLTDTLERKGLVVRAPNPEDRRSKLVRITDAGRSRLEDLLPGHFLAVRGAFSGLTSQELVTLARLLGKLRKGMEQASRELDAESRRAAEEDSE